MNSNIAGNTSGKDNSPKHNKDEVPDGDKKPAAKEVTSEKEPSPQVNNAETETTNETKTSDTNQPTEPVVGTTFAQAYRNPHPLDNQVPPAPAFTPSLLKTPALILRTPAAASYSTNFVSLIERIIC